MYFDDASLTDWRSAKGSGQWAFEQLNVLLGTRFAEEKRQAMASQGVFLGLDHDMSEALSHGHVKFWAKAKLHGKLQGMLAASCSTQRLIPGAAAKVYGLANFLELGMFGKAGAGGLHPIRMRQDERRSTLTAEICRSFELLEAVFQVQPRRVFEVMHRACPRFFAASDAALEVPGEGTGGFLIVWCDAQAKLREGFVAQIPAALYQVWTPGDHKIAQLELSMVLFALMARPGKFRHRTGVWFIDITAGCVDGRHSRTWSTWRI